MIGRSPAEIERSGLVGGTPTDVGPPLLELGVTLFVTGARGPDYCLDELAAWLAWRDAQNASRC